MSYSSVGLMAAAVLIIINHDIILKKKDEVFSPARKAYRRFLYAILLYFLTDILWGFLEQAQLVTWLIVDTTIYFVSMTMAIFFWTRYVVAYLGELEDETKNVLNYSGIGLFAFGVIVVIINFFEPILFWFEADGTYHVGTARYLILAIQLLMFLLSTNYALLGSTRSSEEVKDRHRAIGFFSLAMAAFVILQTLFPLYPLYSVGLMLGTCLVHTFIIGGEKAQYMQELEESLERERQQREELGSTRRLAFTDPLTHVKSKLAYLQFDEEVDKRLEHGDLSEFAVAVFDLNDLKHINDTMGHEVGDEYIVAACRMICNHFKHSPVFRIGGDEFSAFLEGADYQNREQIKEAFARQIEENFVNNGVVVAMGVADYMPAQDFSHQAVFVRADRLMYDNKQKLKERKQVSEG